LASDLTKALARNPLSVINKKTDEGKIRARSYLNEHTNVLTV
jgi:hypothetical protein